jgi:hypothetical protein
MKKVEVAIPHNIHKKTTIEIRASRPEHRVPLIIREYTDGGTRMYETFPGGPYIADTFDRIFLPQKMQVKPEHAKKEGHLMAGYGGR